MKNLQDFIDALYDFSELTFGCWISDSRGNKTLLRKPTDQYGIRAYVGDWAEQHNKDYCWNLTDSELDEVIDAVADLLLD